MRSYVVVIVEDVVSENICREEDNTGYNKIQKNLQHAKRLQTA